MSSADSDAAYPFHLVSPGLSLVEESRPETSLSILLVEDDPTDQYMVNQYLSRGPYNVGHVSRLIDAKEYLSLNTVDLVLLDLHLPDATGLDCFTGVQAASTSAAVVILSGEYDERVALSSVRMGAQDYLLKGDITTTRLDRSIRYAVARKHSENQLVQLAYYDQLTGIPNRTTFDAKLISSLARVDRTGGELAVLMLDLDDFKIVNDSLGHDAGDDLLKQASARLVSCVREYDVVARRGGDEFSILLEGCNSSVVRHRIEEAFSVPFMVSDTSVSVGISIGVAEYPRDSHTREGLLKHADAAMYECKRRKS